MVKNRKERQPPPQPKQPEPDGGPLERTRAFLDERRTPLRKKTDPAPPTPGELPPSGRSAPPHRKDEADDADDAPRAQPRTDDRSAPLGNRQRMIDAYRKRQKQKPKPRPRAAVGAGSLLPPEPPAPPPANNWVPIGPSGLRQGQGHVNPATSGRTPAIAPIAAGNRAYVGAANGGVWSTHDGGASWRSLMDAFDLNPTQSQADSLSVGALAVVAGATAGLDRIYVGSGEGPGGAYFGVGPIVSIDGGQNWVTEAVAPGSPSLAGSAFYALAVDPGDTNRVVAATRQGLFRREPNAAGAFHWARKAPPTPGSAWATSVVAARTGVTTTFYAAFWFGPVYSSADGHTWAAVGTGFPVAGVGRISLAVQSDNPSVVYAFSSEGNVYRLDTAVGTWRQVTGLPAPVDLVRNQGTYDLAIAVAPDNVNRIYLGGATVFSGVDWSGALYRSDITVTAASVTAANTLIGNSVHADIHTIVFTPGSSSQMWVGCDGGVYRTDDATASGDIFTSLNKGLQTLTMNYLGQHPTEDAVLFCGTQDNGGERFTGEEAWLYTSGGDSGYFVVNWNDPYRVADTYVRGAVRRSTTGGTRYSYGNVPVPLAMGEGVLFYAPLVGTPANPGAPGEADILAFGSIRPWISTTFGGAWESIPNNTLVGDQLDGNIKSMIFASAIKLYVGTMAGGVYRFDKSGAAWTRTQLDTLGGANSLPLAGVVSAIAVDAADGTGSSIYITFGSSGDYRHVWHFNGMSWQQRSGPAAGAADALLDIQHNAIVVDPAAPAHLYAGADIGIWRSIDSGATWQVFSDGLPDAAVLDLRLHNPRRLLRASTHGRGAYERTLDALPKQGVELYVRDTQLDQGRFATINFLPDPVNQGDQVAHWRGPDIKVDTPDVNGQYQFPLGATINFFDFVDTLNDDAHNVATHATSTITTRVYVQVHNRGVVPADNVRVMCLLANASAALPALPANYQTKVQGGMPINNANWQTIGIVDVNDVRVGFPKIAAFDLNSNKLPPPANLAGNNHHCVLALVHHALDPYTSINTNTDQNSLQERKAAHKNLTVVQFTGTPPAAPPVVVPFRIHATTSKDKVRSDLVIDLHGYRGRVRLFLPKLSTEGDLEQLSEGLILGRDFGDFKRWASEQKVAIAKSMKSKKGYHKVWSKQRLADISKAVEHGVMFVAGGLKNVALRRIQLKPGTHQTLFLMLDRPANGHIGEAFDLTIAQQDAEGRNVQGGLDVRVELQPKPGTKPARAVKRPAVLEEQNRHRPARTFRA